MRATAWHSIHVGHHDEDQDGLILDAVRPLFGRIAAQAPRAHFLRHWRRGPHLRIAVDTTAEVFAATVRPAVDEIVGEYLAVHPSRAVIDPVRLLPLHRRLAELEQEPGSLLPWYPDNSIQEVAYEHRLDVLGTPEAAELLADFYVAGTPAVFGTLEDVRAGASRQGVAFDLMLATAHCFSGGTVATGFVSFRSHAEAFLAGAASTERLRERWDGVYAARAPALGRRVRDVVAALEEEGESPTPARDWAAVLRPLERRARALLRAGRLTLDPPPPAGAGPRAHLAAGSVFHRALEDNEQWQRDVAPAEWFLLYRLLLNYTYLHLTRLGVTPVQRFLLCHLAANAVEDSYGVSALELVRATASSSANDAPGGSSG